MAERRRRGLAVSYSQLRAYRSCPALYGFQYAEGLRPRVERREYLVTGRVVHEAIAAGYRAWEGGPEAVVEASASALDGLIDDQVAAFRADPEGEGDPPDGELERAMVRHFWSGTLVDDAEHLVPLAVERRFRVDLVGPSGRRAGVSLIGDLDLVAFDRRYRSIVLAEHKTVGGDVFAPSRRLEMDPQTAGYIYALRALLAEGAFDAGLWRLGVEPDRVATGSILYNVVRRAAPREPAVNKDGRVSAAAIDTTAEVYEEALRRHGQHPGAVEEALAAGVEGAAEASDLPKGLGPTDKQLARLEALRAAGNTYFARFEYERSDAEVDRWLSETLVDARRLRRADQDPAERTRNPDHCAYKGCVFWDLCLDPSSDEIRATQFTTPDERRREAQPQRPLDGLGW